LLSGVNAELFLSFYRNLEFVNGTRSAIQSQTKNSIYYFDRCLDNLVDL